MKQRASEKGWRFDIVHEVRQEVARRLAVSMVVDPDQEAPPDVVERIAALLVDIQAKQRKAALDMLADWEASHAAYRRMRDGKPEQGDVAWLGKGWSLATWEAHLLEQREKLHAMLEKAFSLPMVAGEGELPAGRGAIPAGSAPEITIYIPHNGRDDAPATIDREAKP
ncbi:hypothetical protein [Neoroseomonas soli]|uniref:Uncharacterized protein n=1 Tax=Neoroseomonas soli TaxID=1081025 RepID=A0A9X9X0I4_9PROT|nr:hypothetical protein [Neoroseomonas soli]MBR0672913.1 hypothetical protein [Neoroseomonas soli]